MLKGKGKLIGTVASNTVSTGYSGLNMARNPHERLHPKAGQVLLLVLCALHPHFGKEND